MTTTETQSTVFGDVISRYSRAQAIEDGVLVDLMQDETVKTVKEAGFKYPMAMTVAAFSEAVCPLGGELPAGQDLQGRLWDVLCMLKRAIYTQRITDCVLFSVLVSGRRVELKSLCGPGDEGEPVITIMLPEED